MDLALETQDAINFLLGLRTRTMNHPCCTSIYASLVRLSSFSIRIQAQIKSPHNAGGIFTNTFKAVELSTMVARIHSVALTPPSYPCLCKGSVHVPTVPLATGLIRRHHQCIHESGTRDWGQGPRSLPCSGVSHHIMLGMAHALPVISNTHSASR